MSDTTNRDCVGVLESLTTVLAGNQNPPEDIWSFYLEHCRKMTGESTAEVHGLSETRRNIKRGSARTSTVSADELDQFDDIEDAIRYIARKNRNVFRPMGDKVPLIEVGFIDASRYGGNRLNRVLSEMADMQNPRRNRWELTEKSDD